MNIDVVSLKDSYVCNYLLALCVFVIFRLLESCT